MSTTPVNSPPRPACQFFNDPGLIKESSVEYGKLVATFNADGRMFRALVTWNRPLGEAEDDDNDLAAAANGYVQIRRIVAVADDGRPYAVWEFYVDDPNRFLSKAVQVDDRRKGAGIGTAFVFAVRRVIPIAWSGTFTIEGAKLKDRVEAMEKAAGADNSPA